MLSLSLIRILFSLMLTVVQTLDSESGNTLLGTFNNEYEIIFYNIRLILMLVN